MLEIKRDQRTTSFHGQGDRQLVLHIPAFPISSSVSSSACLLPSPTDLAHPSMTYASLPSHRMPHRAGSSRTLRLLSDASHHPCKPSLKGRAQQKCCPHWRCCNMVPSAPPNTPANIHTLISPDMQSQLTRVSPSLPPVCAIHLICLPSSYPAAAPPSPVQALV